ncbi:MAG: hypothetical protein ALECFALPRED_004965 [Alectoria fallacina]|uniref:Uncharacterized protein n=1 Tax=Alectoria fallacina TaxID=1903189 RepID=A0A8H3G169_9LECA|nr:MAG: hypothetical protein ALECFALPRED_004965 [Alectoria fallacina]
MSRERFEIQKSGLVVSEKQLDITVSVGKSQMVEGAAAECKVEKPAALLDIANNLSRDLWGQGAEAHWHG